MTAFDQKVKQMFAIFARFSNIYFPQTGQLVQRELTSTDDVTCPVEILDVPVPMCDPDFDPGCHGDETMPYERAAYDKQTGQSPNNPRRQVCV
jgi:hypothetical protein